MSRKELEIALSDTDGFDDPDWHAEQYSTPPSIAANLIWHLAMSDLLEGNAVLDLGCGSGRLGLGALLLGAKHAYLVDFDGDALTKAEENAEALGLPESSYTTVMNSAEHYDAHNVDVAVMNPPFGTQDKGADTAFLEKASQAADYVLSLHKAATQQYVMEWIVDNKGVLLDQHRIDFPLQNTMSHHDRDTAYVDVIAVLFQTR